MFFFFSSRRRHTRCSRDWSSDVCSSDLPLAREDIDQKQRRNPTKQTWGQAWALQVDCALEVQACLASNRNAIAGDLAPHASTAGTQLRPAQRLLTEARRPIGCECALDRAGSGILTNADGGGKKSAYVVHVGGAGRGNNRTAEPDVEFGEGGDVGRERSHLLGGLHHDPIVARPHDARPPETPGRPELH